MDRLEVPGAAPACCRVATLGEVLDLVQKANAGGKDIGVFVQVA